MNLLSGGTVHMVCRSKERGEAAQEEIKQESKNEVKCIKSKDQQHKN